MTLRRFLMLTSFLALAAVFYIAISKKETNASKMLKIFSRIEDIGFYRMEITPVQRQRLSNGELHREQGRIKYGLAPSRYLRVIRIRLDCFKEIKRLDQVERADLTMIPRAQLIHPSIQSCLPRNTYIATGYESESNMGMAAIRSRDNACPNSKKTIFFLLLTETFESQKTDI